MRFFVLIIFIFAATSVHAQGDFTRRHLTSSQIGLAIKKAEEKAYAEIVREFNVEGQKKKEWLYSMVCLNMAYLQFGGTQGKAGSTTELNRLIRQRLKKYLPQDVLRQPGFIYSLE